MQEAHPTPYQLHGVPRLFGLYDLAGYLVEGETAADLERRWGLETEDAVGWGVEFDDRAFVGFRNPYTGDWAFSVHGTAVAARDRFSDTTYPLHLSFRPPNEPAAAEPH